MKKSLLILALASALLLSGCFGKKDTQKPAAEEAPSGQTVSGQPQKSEETPPSFQDGDIYLKALATKSLEMCGKIKNGSLKTKCEGKVKASAK
ncbi:MAG: hypothetical protein AAB588_04995 [Patescibacteria group bacterium]